MPAGGGLTGKSELTQRIVSALILASVALAVAVFGDWPFVVVWLLLAVAVAHEWLRLVDAERPYLLTGVGAVYLIGSLALTTFGAPNMPVLLGAFAALAMAAVALNAGAGRRRWAAGGIPYIGMLFLSTVLLRGLPGTSGVANGLAAILFLYAAVWLTDIGAYFTGRHFGGPKFAPAISPKKTWSGVLGGLLAWVIGAILVLVATDIPVRVWHVFIALVLGMAVVAGDLFESWLKRKFGVKDAGALIPGHGGFMDRLDGYVFAAFLAALIGIMRGGWENAAGGLLR